MAQKEIREMRTHFGSSVTHNNARNSLWTGVDLMARPFVVLIGTDGTRTATDNELIVTIVARLLAHGTNLVPRGQVSNHKDGQMPALSV